MARPIRNRAFLSVGIGIIDQNAQASGTVNGAFAYWSKGNIFDINKQNVEYGTLEENYMKADGKIQYREQIENKLPEPPKRKDKI